MKVQKIPNCDSIREEAELPMLQPNAGKVTTVL
jgi:hypothetical protein